MPRLSRKRPKLATSYRQTGAKSMKACLREERRERGGELRKKTAELAETAAMTMAESLDDTQKQRWLQITLEVRGPAMLPGEYLAEQLSLDDGQVKKLNELTAAQREKRSAVFRQSREDGLSREAVMEKFRCSHHGDKPRTDDHPQQ